MPSLLLTSAVLLSSRMMSMHNSNALIADEHGRPGDELANFMLALAAE